MERLFILACFLGTSQSLTSGSAGRLRVKDGSVKHANVCQSVEQLLDQAHNGIKAKDLESEVTQIHIAVNAYLNSHRGEVALRNGQASTGETSAPSNAGSTGTAAVRYSLSHSTDLLWASFTLLEKLCNIIDTQEKAGEFPSAALHTLSLTLKDIWHLLQDIGNNGGSSDFGISQSPRRVRGFVNDDCGILADRIRQDEVHK